MRTLHTPLLFMPVKVWKQINMLKQGCIQVVELVEMNEYQRREMKEVFKYKHNRHTVR